MVCVLDTGIAGVLWNKSLGINGHIVGQDVCYDAGGNAFDVSDVVTPSIKIGAYEAVNVWGLERRDSVDSTLNSPIANGSMPLVGNSVFSQIVLTIDYKKRVLLLRDPHAASVQQTHDKNVIRLGFKWADRDIFAQAGTPIVAARVADVPVKCTIDTGWCGAGLGLSERILNKIRDLNDQERNQQWIEKDEEFINGRGRVQYAPEVPLTLGAASGVKLSTDAETLPAAEKAKFVFKEDGAIGYDVLRRFRVTLDYPRQEILLEPYSAISSSPQPKKRASSRRTKILVKSADGTERQIWVPQGETITILPDGTIVSDDQKNHCFSDLT